MTTRGPPPAGDWHREEIKCAIRLKGYSIASLSRANGLAGGTLANALTRPWPKGEKIIASLLGLEPADIWPSRYEARKAKKHRQPGVKKTKAPSGGNDSP
ncbi:helix-turn-helix domain-containing protein [Erwinia persicina]|uniref:helix-turn-helix domain-containing protein n=1 Tax=Erwinia persicina TaxID=55211 RepID=UPI00177AAC73|nr:helix-turn-helix transcriptional regulator [Erwinia persicina]MBD8164469.1 helix-turn-helix domain-containing protein [Erwinia persicina]MBD8216117.1 helix-turn-helix domain-containing protein [Erwinia persicina]